MENIDVGDSVTSRSKPLLNGGIAMNVSDVHDEIAICDYFDGPEATDKRIGLPFSDLIIVHKAEGGFRNFGEAP